MRVKITGNTGSLKKLHHTSLMQLQYISFLCSSVSETNARGTKEERDRDRDRKTDRQTHTDRKRKSNKQFTIFFPSSTSSTTLAQETLPTQ